MTAPVSTAEFDKHTNALTDRAKELSGAFGKVDDSFDRGIDILRTGSFFGGLAGYFIGNKVIDKLRDNQKEIKETLDEISGKVDELLRGSAAPLLYIKATTDWNNAAAQVRGARNSVLADTNLTGYWSGVASERYGTARDLQDKAMEAAEGICTKIGENMTTLGKSGIELYSGVVEEVTSVLTQLGGSLALVAAGVTAPWGAQELVEAVVAALDAVVAIMTKVIAQMTDQAISAEDLRNATNTPYGLPNNTWPTVTSDRFADASTADGNSSKWDVAE